jgi:hypothetical protein
MAIHGSVMACRLIFLSLQSLVALYTGSFIKNEPIWKLYFAVRKQRRGKSRMPLQRA